MNRPRTTTWIALGTLVVAGALGLAAVSVAGSSSDGAELSAPPASAPVAPSTIGPLGLPSPSYLVRSLEDSLGSPTAATPGPAATPAPAAGPTLSPVTPVPPVTTVATTTTTTTTTMPLSPLGALVGEPVSVVPATRLRPSPPARISIGALAIDVPVRAVGVEPDGQLEIPDETEVGWYRLGSSPGEPGASVLAGHVSWNRTTGPFFRLSELEPGATIDVGLADGTSRTYEVVERAQYPKQALPVERIWATSGPETLVLVTCGGAFNPDIRRYADNIVVYAVPVAWSVGSR